MKKFQKYLISLGISFISLIVLTLILSFINYFSLIPYKLNIILKELIPIMSIFIGNIYLGLNIDKNGYIEGLKTGGVFIFILLILSLIFSNFKATNILIYLLILLFSSISTIISINLKSTKENP